MDDTENTKRANDYVDPKLLSWETENKILFLIFKSGMATLIQKTTCQEFGTKWEYTINSKQAFPSISILLRR